MLNDTHFSAIGNDLVAEIITRSLLGNGNSGVLEHNTIDLVPITYSALKTLRDTNKLVVGRKYRITDYETTTSQIDTMSAGNPFDIIVEAIEVNKLSEKASAIQRVAIIFYKQ